MRRKDAETKRRERRLRLRKLLTPTSLTELRGFLQCAKWHTIRQPEPEYYVAAVWADLFQRRSDRSYSWRSG
jgi:hypothetical protein